MAAISVEKLSKRYILQHKGDGREGLRHTLENALRSPFQRLRERLSHSADKREEFWALRDVSFEIKQGDAVAIIGRNGAGKSTLLKILSRITEPTAGRIHLKGRVASLLEVGTGFHQELTGRENIFLNGAILGMSKAEIARRFDEIVAFSEVEKFLDTPVKRYSSGMYVRLAFAVAAHLEPEILIIDEVLAVGDGAFQKKCLGRMGEVTKEGRTVLFVSHNMAAVQALCTRAVYLKAGHVHSTGEAPNLVDEYLADSSPSADRCIVSPVALGSALKLISFDFTPDPVETGATLSYRMVFRCESAITISELAISISSAHGARVSLLDLRSIGLPVTLKAGRTWEVNGAIEPLTLVEGDYSVGLTINTGEFWENVFDLSMFTVNAKVREDGIVPYPVVYRGLVEFDTVTTHSTRAD